MKHICVMGLSDEAHIIAQNAVRGIDTVVTCFSTKPLETLRLAPMYAVSYWVPKADFYIVVADNVWPISYFNDVAEKYGANHNVMYVGYDLSVVTEHVRKFQDASASFCEMSEGSVYGEVKLDIALPSGPRYYDHKSTLLTTFKNVERLRLTTLPFLYAYKHMQATMYETIS